ncbi:MAG: ABC transporter substrate-binding protein [Actinomycetes bacterium]
MRRRTSTRARGWLLAAVGVSLASLLATACSSGTPSATSSASGKSISYLYFTNGPDLQATKTLIATYEKQTGVTVNLQVVPYSNLNQVLQARVSAGDPPEVVQTSNPAAFGPDLVNLGQVLGAAWVKTISPNLLGSGLYQGAVVGLPNQLTVMGPFVNVAMFRKAGVPVPSVTAQWTWPEMVAAAKKVQAANHTPFALAMDHSGARVANVLCQYGAYLYGDSGTGTMNTAAATQALTMLSGLFESNTMSKAAWIAAGSKYVAGDTQFLAGQAPVLLSGSWEVAAFATSVPFTWAVTPNPVGTVGGGMSGGNYMVAFKSSKNPALGAQFIKFMSEPANQGYMSTVSSTIPSAVSLATPGSVQYPGAAKQAMEAFNKAATLMPAGCNLSEANPGFSQAATTVMNQLTSVVAGQTTVPKAVAATVASAANPNS